MQNSPNAVEDFMRDFERSIASGNMDALLALFADPFLAAMPQGAKVISSADYAKALAARSGVFKRIGCTSTTLVGVESMPLSPRYALAFTKWRWTFESGNSKAKEVGNDAAYIVDTGAEPFKIVVYLPADDVMAVLKQNGLLAA